MYFLIVFLSKLVRQTGNYEVSLFMYVNIVYNSSQVTHLGNFFGMLLHDWIIKASRGN